MTSATRIATAGFTLIRTRPRAVLAWGFVYLLFAVVVSLLTHPMIERMMLAMPRPGVAAAPLVMDWSLFGPVIVANLGMYGMMLILLAAAMRAVLKPEEQGAFFIRVGMDELRLLGTLALLLLLGLAVYFVAIIVLTFVVTIGALLSGSAASAAGNHLGVFVTVAVLMLAIFAAMIVFQIRFMLALPLTILRGRIVVKEAWRRSKGHFWRLFGGSLLGGMIVMAVSLVIAVPMFLVILGSGDGLSVLYDPARQMRLMQSPLLYPLWLLTPLLGGFFAAMTGGALGQAVLETETAG